MNSDSSKFCGCPYCEAIFRLPEDKLIQRAGMVRCGACREVFDANSNLVTKSKNGFVPVNENGNQISDIDFDDDAEINSDIYISKGSEDHSITIQIPSRKSDSDDVVSHFLNFDSEDDNTEIRRTPNNGLMRDRGDFSQIDEKEIDNPFEDRSIRSYGDTDENSENLLKDNETRDYVDRHELTIERLDVDSEQSIEIVPDSVEQHPDSEDEIPRSLNMEQLWDEQDSSVPRGFEFTESENSESGKIDQGLSADSSNPISENRVLEDSTLGRMTRNGVDEYIGQRTNPLMSFIWFIVSLGFVLLLGMQVKYFFVERYAQDETYRKYLVGFCKITRCELPPRMDPFRYTLTHTKIDLHPTQPGALRVTVKLVNEADFAQPYPHLQLTLTDKVGRVVGRRTFSPEFYLLDDDRNLIGEGNLASIVFDLARPHEKAVGFVVDIVTGPAPS